MDKALEHVLAAVLYGLVGMGLFLVALWATTKVLPFSLRKEVEEDHNVALAILVGAVFLGIAWIVGSAVQG